MSEATRSAIAARLTLRVLIAVGLIGLMCLSVLA